MIKKCVSLARSKYVPLHMLLASLLLPTGDAVKALDISLGKSSEQITLHLPLSVESSYPALKIRASKLREQLQNNYKIDAERSKRFAWWIVEAAWYHDIPESILASLIMTESSFRYKAVSRVGAIGPAQIRPEVWSNFCLYDIREPGNNVFCAARILAHYHRRFGGSWSDAVTAYNVGPSRINTKKHKNARARYLKKMGYYEITLSGIEVKDNENL
jgi:soluble lytic murein transglycosylase-like protein